MTTTLKIYADEITPQAYRDYLNNQNAVLVNEGEEDEYILFHTVCINNNDSEAENTEEEVEIKKYSVRLEFTVVESEFADVEVEASSREEAIKKAIALYEDDASELEYYAGEQMSHTLDSSSEDWNVEEVEA